MNELIKTIEAALAGTDFEWLVRSDAMHHPPRYFANIYDTRRLTIYPCHGATPEEALAASFAEYKELVK